MIFVIPKPIILASKKLFGIEIRTDLSRYGIDIDVLPNIHRTTLGLFIGRLR